MIAARNGWIICLDNLSDINAWRSDALCRLATGGGFATRELHTDADEIIFDAMRPLILNGIDGLATRGDLIDRSIVLTLPVIPEDERRDEQSFWLDFDEAAPRLLGALLDAVSTGLARVATTRVVPSPRMADFARWGVACEPSLPWPPGSFMAAYTGNREESHELTLEASPLSAPLRRVAEAGFEGTATELLAELESYADQAVIDSKTWPKAANKLSAALKRLNPTLRAVGIIVEFAPPGKRKLIVVRTAGDSRRYAVDTETIETPANVGVVDTVDGLPSFSFEDRE